MTKKSFTNNWKPVTIGGMTGILVGTGAAMAYQPMASDSKSDEVVGNTPKPAASNDDMSFPEAFNAARAELGSGKTFEWHGKTYSTCTRKEWEEMLAAENDNTDEQEEEETLAAATLDESEKDETEQPIVKNQSNEKNGQDDVLVASRESAVKNNEATVTVEEDAVKDNDSEQAIIDEMTKDAKSQEDNLIAGNDATVKNEEPEATVEDTTVKNEEAPAIADETTVKDDVAEVTVDESAVKNEEAPAIADETTVKDDVAEVTVDESAVKNEEPEVTVDEATVKNEAAAANEDVTIKNNPTTEDVTANVVDSPSEESQEDLTWNQVVNDDDVRILGYGDVVLNNGREVTIQELDVNGQRVAVIDIDQDGTADIAVTDLNHNNQPDDGEILDLHTGETYSLDDQSPIDDNDVNIEFTQL